MIKKRWFIIVQGIVQGVGFRPFVYNKAVYYGLKGWVNNNSEGVYIDIEGAEDKLLDFLNDLKKSPPPLSKIENIIIKEKSFNNYSNFTIAESEEKNEKITLISPDISTCKDCLNDIKDPHNRRYRYPFTNCTNCGPRFSIIKSIPYDRDKTTMNKFKMCPKCFSEYTDPTYRRFHAQPNACDVCGPKVWLCNSNGQELNCEDPINLAIKKLKEGSILGVKGLCGFHLVCDAKNSSTVELLRNRKKRPYKPFAVMAKNIETAQKYCSVNTLEEELLTGMRKPIVILNRNESYDLPQSIAPNQKTLGVMLPYTPLHELLFMGGLEMLVMTSANVYGLPLEYVNDNAIENLSSIADYFLMHNRDIHIPVDDSVIRVINNKPRMIRRARGYVPDPLNGIDIKDILALGPNMKNTFCIAKENFLFLSQHNGDLENLETFNHFKRNIEHFNNIFCFKPKYIAMDMHPLYLSTQYGETLPLPKVPVQHHHAHVVSCMFENKVNNELIGIAFDGTGYGIDGHIWGSEFLKTSYSDFKRLGHLEYISMPGSEKSIKEPWRMAISYIYKAFPESYMDILKKLYGDKSLNIIKLLQSNINCPLTSSMGRLFDGVSSIIGIADKATYEGQASIELEACIKEACSDNYAYEIIKQNEEYIIKTDSIIKSVVQDKLNGLLPSIMSCKFHNTIVKVTTELCSILRKDTGLNEVALSGGVFQNSYLLQNTILSLQKEHFIVYSHKDIPSNDGGVSLGQLIICNEKLKEG